MTVFTLAQLREMHGVTMRERGCRCANDELLDVVGHVCTEVEPHLHFRTPYSDHPEQWMETIHPADCKLTRARWGVFN